MLKMTIMLTQLANIVNGIELDGAFWPEQRLNNKTN